MRTSPLKGLMQKGNSQGLSTSALKAKRARDKAAAMTTVRKNRKAENQRIGQSSNQDLHHTSSGNVIKTSVKNNRNVWKHGERK